VAQIMVTNGGPHPAEKWAEVSANEIGALIQIDPNSPIASFAEEGKTQFVDKLKTALAGTHGEVQAHEREQIKQHGVARLSHLLDPTNHARDGLAAVVAAAQGTMFQGHFAKPETQEYVLQVLAQHKGTVMDIERSWHADRTLADAGKGHEHDECRAYHQARTDHGGHLVHAHIHRYRKSEQKKSA
jgi:hypothetical protein